MARIAGWDGGEDATPTPPPTPTATPMPTPNITHIDSNPFLFCYQGVACDLPDALTNFGPTGLNIVTIVWGKMGLINLLLLPRW